MTKSKAIANKTGVKNNEIVLLALFERIEITKGFA
jgi:hypothetical protein